MATGDAGSGAGVPPAGAGDPGRRRFAAAAERNRDPILAVLKRVLPAAGVVLEVASGTGQHAAHFASRLPGLVWQPSDPDPDMRASIAAWAAAAGAPNLRPPLALDVAAGRHTAPSNAAFDAALRRRDPAWGVRDLDAVAAAAAAHDLALAETVPMPANNLSVVFRKD